jgi:hypothetical protein
MTKQGLEHNQRVDSEGSDHTEHSLNTDSRGGHAATTGGRSKKRERCDGQTEQLPRKSYKGQTLDSDVLGIGMFTHSTASTVVSKTTNPVAVARVTFMRTITDPGQRRTEQRQAAKWLCGTKVPHYALLCALEIDFEVEEQAAIKFAFKSGGLLSSRHWG